MESILVKFKSELKKVQHLRKDTLKKYENEAKSLTALVSNPGSDDISLFQLQFWYPQIYCWLEKEMATLAEFYRKKKLSFNYAKALCSMVNNILNSLRSEYSKYQEVINACDNNKVIAPITNFDYLLSSLELSNLSDEEMCKIFGMFISFCDSYIKKNSNFQIDGTQYISILGNYFNSDGSFKYASNEDAFVYALELLFKDLLAKDGDKSYYQEILNSFALQLYASNEQAFMDSLTPEFMPALESPSKKAIVTEGGSYDSLNKLKKYYKNGKLIQLPENLNNFKDLLLECQVDEREKRYILGLIEEELEKLNQDKILNYLSDEERKLYMKAFGMFEILEPSHIDFVEIAEIMGSLRVAADILSADEEGREYATSEIKILMTRLEEIVSKYEVEAQKENNLLFLCDSNEVAYLQSDFEELDDSFSKMISNGLRKITKENQTSFGPVYTYENVPFRLYDITSAKVHITFIELTIGVYLIVGVKQHGKGYDELVKRVISNVDKINSLEALLKDENTRNELLANHMQYLNLFNSLNPDETLKRS